MPVITQVEAGEPAAVDLVDELPQRVERLLADVAAHPLQRLDLVEHEHQPGCPASRRTVSSPWRKLSAPKWSMSPLTPAAALGRGGDVRLAASQASEPVGGAVSPSASARRR